MWTIRVASRNMEKAMANSEQSWVATGGGKDEKTEEPICQNG